MKRRIMAFLCAVTLLSCCLMGCSGGGASTSENVSSGFYTVHARVPDNWQGIGIWAWSDSRGNLSDSWPGEAMHGEGPYGWFTYDVPTWADWLIISGNNGASQTADIPVQTRELWIYVYDNGDAAITYKNPSKSDDAWDSAAFIYTGDAFTGTVYSTTEPAYSDYGNSGLACIDSVDGYWKSVNLKDGDSNYDVQAFVFDEPIYYCAEMTITMNVSMNAGTNCKDWQLWGRSGSNFVKLDRLYLPDGDGYGSQTVTFNPSVSLNAIAITPTIPGGYSWSMGISVTDVWIEP